MTLVDLFNSKGYEYYPTDKQTHHRYLTSYEDLFSKWRNEEFNLLEVGTYKGGSMRLFEDYFVNACILGYDIVPPEVSLNRAQVRIKDFYSINIDELPPLTIAIDDGPHGIGDQMTFVKMVWPKLVTGGILVVEDVRPGFRPYFDSLKIPYTLIETIPYIDEDNDRLLVYRK